MPKNEKGLVHVLLLILLLAGIALGVYLVQQKTNLLPKAFFPGVQPPEILPSTGLALISIPKTITTEGSTVEENVKQETVNIFQGMGTIVSKPPVTVRLSYYPGEEIIVKLYATSDIDEANLFTAKIKFNKDILEVTKIDLERSFIQNWVEQTYDNSTGSISLTGGVPSPGYKTTPGNPAFMGIIVFKGKTTGTATMSFTDESAIYRNSDNQNILQIKVDSTVSIVKKPDDSCAQIITPAKDLKSGVCKEFSSPCDVPDGWVKVPSCKDDQCPTPPPCKGSLIYGDPQDKSQCPVYVCQDEYKKGDGNKDGKINLTDMSILLTDFNKETGFREPIDMNDDKKINSFDFSLMRKQLIELKVIKGQ